MKLAEPRTAGPVRAAPGQPAAGALPDPPRRQRLGYSLLVVAPAVVGTAALLGTARAGVGGPSGPAAGVSQTAVFLLAAAMVFVTARAAGAFAVRLGQPQVIGEICAGILLGPSALGAVAPDLAAWIFPAPVVIGLDGLAQVGLVLFMFGVGQELAAVRGAASEARGAALVALASFLVPFAAGLLLATWLFPQHAGGPVGSTAFALFVGCALGVTAFPVLARILSDLHLTSSRTGRLSLYAAGMGDGVCWAVLTVALALAQGHSAAANWRTLLLLVLAAVILGPVRIALRRLLDGRFAGSPGTVLTLCIAGTAASAALTAALGVHQLIGAFLFGLAWPAAGGGRAGSRPTASVASLATLLLPFFFLGFGLSLDLRKLAFDRENLVLLAVLLVVATVSKVAGAGLAGHWSGLPRTEALGLGVLMNTRGLTELVVLGVGHQAGVIDARLFAALVLVTLVTTATTGPALRALRVVGASARSGPHVTPVRIHEQVSEVGEMSQDKAVAQWREILGEAGVSDDGPSTESVLSTTSVSPPRQIVAVLRPTAPAQVPEVVRVAREHKVPLYPVSRGCNWGLGSRLPVTSGCALLDLSGLDRIREVDPRGRFAVVEPGVTQAQLAGHLRQHAPGLVPNVTGSSPHSSIVGNLLERGTGFRRHRAEEVRGLEVVLGTGELLRTGLWAGDGKRQLHHYRHGLGPGLDHLFVQSGMGIVTAAVVDLVPVRDELRLVMFSLAEPALPRVMDTIAELFTANALDSIVHVFNNKRIGSMSQSHEVPMWTGVVALDGTAAQVAAGVGYVGDKLTRAGAQVRVVDSQDAAADPDPVVSAMFAVHAGRPTTAFLEGLHRAMGHEPAPSELDTLDDTTIGYLACMPVVAVSGETVRDLVELVESVCERYGIAPAMAVNPTGPDYAEVVINLYFDRAAAGRTEAAHACNADLHERLYADGFRFYRVGIDAMDFITHQDTAPWGAIGLIKNALDPDGIIAPGRYSRITP
ncbi:Kef-type K+ transport system, membrane component KefB [Micromonospora matsumotoense]|uniref:Kef-type K+ transport system, membrane component KefB n=1 Tax=Micromonospora matsumotoense TaxID=121616 RepID=A0A1C4ZQ84_9ACTN|nr:Kef-type K+ transport system, membrane component KefB [Micromonospora matsumotoense]